MKDVVIQFPAGRFQSPLSKDIQGQRKADSVELAAYFAVGVCALAALALHMASGSSGASEVVSRVGQLIGFA